MAGGDYNLTYEIAGCKWRKRVAETRTISVDEVKPGDRLGRDIIVNDTVFLMQGVVLTEANIKRIERLGLSQITIAVVSAVVRQSAAEAASAAPIIETRQIPQPNFQGLSTEDDPVWMADAKFSQSVTKPRVLPAGEQLFCEKKHQIRDAAGLKPLISPELDAELAKGIHSALISSAVKGTVDLSQIDRISAQLSKALTTTPEGYIAFDDMPRFIAFTDVPRYGDILAARNIMSSKLVACTGFNSEQVDFDEQIRAHLAISNAFALLPTGMASSSICQDPAKREPVKNAILKYYEWLRSQQFVSERALELMLLRFERFDGSGFPYGLKGEVLPPVSQSWSLGWHYSEQLYSSPDSQRVSARAAADGLVQQSGRAFGGAAVNQFLLRIGYYPIGSMVEINDGRLGLVVQQNDRALLKPVIRNVNPDGSVGTEVDLTRHSDMFISRQILEY